MTIAIIIGVIVTGLALVVVMSILIVGSRFEAHMKRMERGDSE